MQTNSIETHHSTTLQYVHWFRHSAPYINAHRNKTFVIMFDGEAVQHDNFQHIIHDIALLHSLRYSPDFGAWGASANQPQLKTKTNYKRHFISIVASPPVNHWAAVMNAVGSIRLQIEALLSMGLANSPMYGARIDVVSGNFVTAKPYGIRDGVDFQLTGEVRTVDTDAIQRHLDSQNIVLLGPTGYSTTGEVFNLLAEEVATRTAIHLKADKLIFLGKQHGLLNEHGQLQREISPHKLDAQIEEYQDSNPDIAVTFTRCQKSLDAWRTSRPSDFLCL